MILTHHSAHDSDLKRLARSPHQLPNSFRNFISQHFVPVLRYPYKVRTYAKVILKDDGEFVVSTA